MHIIIAYIMKSKYLNICWHIIGAFCAFLQIKYCVWIIIAIYLKMSQNKLFLLKKYVY